MTSRIRPLSLLLLCLAGLLHSFSGPGAGAPRRSRGISSIFVLAARDPDNLVDPVLDTWDYSDPNEPPLPVDGDLDTLRPSDSDKPGVNAGGKNENTNKDKGGGKNQNKNGDNGMKTTKNKNKKENNANTMTNANDAVDDTMMATADAFEPGVGPEVIDGDVAVLPEAINASVVVSTPGILPALPVDTAGVPELEDAMATAVLPATLQEDVVSAQAPAGTTSGTSSGLGITGMGAFMLLILGFVA